MTSVSAARLFKERFGEMPEMLARAPGRVNLIGEHTDYNDGFVLPAAIDHEVWAGATRTGTDECVIYSDATKSEAKFSLNNLQAEKLPKWAKYVAGVANAMQEKTNRKLPGIQLALASGVKMGVGLSSSAAVELAPAVIWNALAELALTPLELAKIGQSSENNFLKLKSGLMDQMASAMGVKDHALYIDMRDFTCKPVPISRAMTIIVLDTGKSRGLTGSKYNERRSECEQAVVEIQKIYPEVHSLRDVDVSMFEKVEAGMSEIPRKRARHVINENARVGRMVDMLSSNNFKGIHALMAASHESLKLDYEVSSPELDAMVEAAEFAPGCIGVRMTGAGFGGSCVALVESPSVHVFLRSVENSYRQKMPKFNPSLIPCTAVDGASVKPV